MTLITALMVVQNEATYIELAIKSIIDYVDTILVFDNLSTDNTVKIVKQLSNPKIQLVQSPSKLLILEAFKQAQNLVQTEWMIRWDGDFVASDIDSETLPGPSNIHNLFNLIHNLQLTPIDGIYLHALNLYGDFHHTSKTEFKIYNIFVCKKSAIQFDTNTTYALTYSNSPDTKFLYYNDLQKYPFYIYHLGGVKSDTELVYRMFKNEYNLYLKTIPNNSTIEDYLTTVLKKNITGTVTWFKKNLKSYITKHSYPLPSILLNLEAPTKYLIKYHDNTPIRKTYTNSIKVQNHRITFVIRVYHNESQLKACLNSIFAQSYTNYQVMIVNDQLNNLNLDEYMDPSKKSLIKLIEWGEYIGPIKSYQTALLNAETEVVAILDETDIISSTFLCDTMGLYNTHKTGNICVWGKKSSGNPLITFKPIHYFMTEGIHSELLFGGYLIDILTQLETFAKPIQLSGIISTPQPSTLPSVYLLTRSLHQMLNYHLHQLYSYKDYVKGLPNTLPDECFTSDEVEPDRKSTPNDYFDHIYV